MKEKIIFGILMILLLIMGGCSSYRVTELQLQECQQRCLDSNMTYKKTIEGLENKDYCECYYIINDRSEKNE